MTVTPNSVIRILKGVPFNSTYRDSTIFSSTEAQTNYFIGKTFKQFSNCTYVRESNTIKVECNADEIHDCNYIMYKNTNFNNKWFYAFINEVKYISNTVCEISFDIDVIQTYQFDFEILQCFVEREHTKNDTIGNNTQPENLELGEYIKYNELMELTPTSWYYVVVTTEWLPDPTAMSSGIYKYGESYSPNQFAFKELDTVSNYLKELNVLGKIDSVIGVYMLPSWGVNNRVADTGFMGGNNEVTTLEVRLNKKYDSLDGWTPKNNKLYTYPYHFIQVTNHLGANIPIEQEYITGSDIIFKLYVQSVIGGKCKITPLNYKGIGENEEYGIETFPYPQLPFTTDSFQTWLAQNENTNRLAMLGSLTNNVMSVATGNIGGFVSSISNITNILGKKKDLQTLPNQCKGNITGNILIGKDKFIGIYRMGIKNEYAIIIDEFFTMYGYATNRIKKPNINTRPYFNYVKTIGAKIKGDLSNEETTKICNIFDSGITLWKNPDHVGNYSLDNSIN
jgi:hypothetical protein